jgi:hypothetical protein
VLWVEGAAIAMALQPHPSPFVVVAEQAGAKGRGAVQSSRAALGVEGSMKKRRVNEEDSLV